MEKTKLYHVICYTLTSFTTGNFSTRKACTKFVIYDLVTHQMFRKYIKWNTIIMPEAEVFALTSALRFLNNVHIVTNASILLLCDGRQTVEELGRLVAGGTVGRSFREKAKPFFTMVDKVRELDNTVTVAYTKGYNTTRHFGVNTLEDKLS